MFRYFLVVTLLLALAKQGFAGLEPGRGEMMVRGMVEAYNASLGQMTMKVVAVRSGGSASETELKQSVTKVVNITAKTEILTKSGRPAKASDLAAGAEVTVVGDNLGKGKPLPARGIELYLPDGAGTGVDPIESVSAPSVPVASSTLTAGASGSYSLWADPAGYSFNYPSAWKTTAALGANPVSFTSGNVVLYARRLPVDSGSTSQARVADAASITRGLASQKGWQVNPSSATVAGTQASVLVIEGTMSLQDVGLLLGVSAASKQAGQGLIYLAYVPVPANTGREQWALEIGVGGPASSRSAIASTASTLFRSISFGRHQQKEAPAYNNPMRSGNTVQVESALKQLATAVQTYFIDNDDRIPANLESIASYIGSPELMLKMKQGWPQWKVGPVQILQPGKRISELGDPSSTAIAKADGPGYSIILYADGHVAKKSQ